MGSARRTDGPADLSSVRRHNLGLVLGELARSGPASRAELAKRSGLTKVTASSLVAELLERGLVREHDESTTGRAGRPATPIAIEPDGAGGLGLLVDVDRVAACVVDLSGAVRHEGEAELGCGPRDPKAVLARLTTLARKASRHADRLGIDVVGAAMALPGLVDDTAGRLYVAPNLGWRDLHLDARMRHVLPPRAPRWVLVNEANAAAIAARARSPEVTGNFLFVNLGVGVGAGVMLEGRLFSGSRGFGGELGHTTVFPGGPCCSCGNRGCLEALVGRDALARTARNRLGRRFGKARGDAAIDRLAALAEASEPDALAVLEEAGTWLGTGLSTFANLFDPECIVLGGYGPRLAPWLVPPIERLLARSVLGAEWAPSRVVPATLGVDAPLVGAGLLALERVFADPTLG